MNIYCSYINRHKTLFITPSIIISYHFSKESGIRRHIHISINFLMHSFCWDIDLDFNL